MADTKPIRYEIAVEQIEQIIEQIESGELGLEDAIKRCAEGKQLVQHCRGVLDAAEKKIAELVVDPDNGLAVEGETDAQLTDEDDR